ncbi:MAG: hypothetical protein N2314_03530 [Brevinematales bacterium]|nr:hypothetical protein [Brevinematales bacterium]
MVAFSFFLLYSRRKKKGCFASRRRRMQKFLLALLLGLPLFVHAQVNTNIETNGFLDRFYQEENTQVVKTEGGGWFWVVVKIFFYTSVFAVGGFFLVRYFVKKSAVETTEDATFIEVIAVKQTGLGGYIEVIKVGANYYLVATSGDGGVRLLDKIVDRETIDYIELHKDTLKPKPQEFMNLMEMFPFVKKVDRTQYIKSQKDRLKKL